MAVGTHGSPEADGSPLARRLNYLFATMHPPGAPYTNAHVAEAISGGDEYGGVSLTEQYLSMLRNGKRTNPSPDVLRALAKFFAVPVGYLLGDLSPSQAERVEEEVRFLVAMRDKRVRGIALRSVGLPPEVQDSLAAIISQFRQQMNLPPDPADAGGPGGPGGPRDPDDGAPSGRR
ncbi:helix-turn-helix transcriptional regulator [Streptomyces sp. FXJ1.4098]|uniref:helix-turn-helix domain-containing protein n=1 Tax=Streptomyces sp. NPDC020845 TaxID=3365096 RepID=UPI002998226F|nr:helix-turn-helix transcriptional regulator [Streptomyces sp. FXJ1.4098]